MLLTSLEFSDPSPLIISAPGVFRELLLAVPERVRFSEPVLTQQWAQSVAGVDALTNIMHRVCTFILWFKLFIGFKFRFILNNFLINGLY